VRYSALFGKTKRDAPAEISEPTLRLGYRAGLVRPGDTGRWLFLPLATNVINQMSRLLRSKLVALGAHELLGVTKIDPDALAAGEIQSYKQLPARMFWTNSGGTRLHVISFESHLQASQETRAQMRRVAAEFFEYAGVPAHTAEDVERSEAWYASSPALDLEIARNQTGSYVATRAAVKALKPRAAAEPLGELAPVPTPDCDTIESLSRHLEIPPSRTAKAVFYANGEQIVFAVVRGDLQVDEAKVKRLLNTPSMRRATDDEIRSVGATPGYASPIGTKGATIVVDDSIADSPNLVAGANREGYHLLNVNVPRDFRPDVVTDIAQARAGDASPDGQGTLEFSRGITLGRVSAPRELNASFLNVNGKPQKPHAVSLELELGAALLAHTAAHHDDKGIVWARALAPYDVSLVVLNADKPEVSAALAQVQDSLARAGLEALVDDRNESPGVKFTDADLVGLPLRITVSPKTTAAGTVELKPRAETTSRLVPLAELAQELERWTDSP
jgi:prolyl-tRNA synthetase